MKSARRPLAAALLVLAGAAGAQPVAPAGAVTQSVEVRALDVDVVATTKDGRPVDDLARDEIVMRVDGRQLPIDYFARVSAGTVHGPDLATASPDLILETTRADSGERFLARQFLLFFDDAHLLPPERGRVIEAMRDFVTRLTPSDRVSLVAYGTTTRVFVPFTASKEDLLDGLDRLSKLAPSGLRYDSEYRQTVTDIRRSPRASTRGELVRLWAEQAAGRERALLEELRRSISALGARRGKRVLVLVSDGIELRPGQSLAQALGPSALMQFERDVTAEFRAAVAEANRAGVRVDSVDARGLTSDVDASSSVPSPFSSFLVSQNLREALQGFSDATGGVFVADRNAFAPALDRIYRASSSYYAVGVTLASVDPKRKEHAIEVTTTRPGVVLSTRRSAVARTAGEAARDRMEAALLNPGEAGDFPATVTLGPTEKGGGLGHRIVPFQLSVPVSALTFREEAGHRAASLEVSIAAVSDDGARSGITTTRVNALAAPGIATWSFATKLKSGKGNIRFVATLRDLATDRMAIASASVRVE